METSTGPIGLQDKGRHAPDGRSLEHKPAHADIQQQADGGHGGHERAAAVAEQDQRDSDNREQARDHAHVDDHLPEEHRRDTRGNR